MILKNAIKVYTFKTHTDRQDTRQVDSASYTCKIVNWIRNIHSSKTCDTKFIKYSQTTLHLSEKERIKNLWKKLKVYKKNF